MAGNRNRAPILYPIPDNEDARLAALDTLALSTHRDDPVFEAICRRAAADFDVPVAALAVIDRDRVWFKGRWGMETTEVPRAVSFCAHTILADGPLVVEDARLDPRFAGNPYVTGRAGLRFYAGAPIRYGEDLCLGTLCVVDRSPRAFGPARRRHLARLATRAAREIWVEAATRERDCYLID